MKITVEPTKRYIVEFDETDKKNICEEIALLVMTPALTALQALLENPVNR